MDFGARFCETLSVLELSPKKISQSRRCPEPSSPGRTSRMVTVPTLNLVREIKICDLLACDEPSKRWEASGVLVKDGHFFVVFDNCSEIGRFSDDLQSQPTNGL